MQLFSPQSKKNPADAGNGPLSAPQEDHMPIRTDLAIESTDTADGKLPEGVFVEQNEQDGIKLTTVRIDTEEASRRLGKPPGRYLTFEIPITSATDNGAKAASLLAEKLAEMLPAGPVLVAGLGNEQITPDALGPRAARQILATRHIGLDMAAKLGLEGLRPVCSIAPGVLGQTGIETAEMIASVARDISPAAVVVIDALVSRSLSRLGATVQLSDTGIAPGGGVLNQRAALNQKSLGVPVISVGVPTVVDGATMVTDLGGGQPSEEASGVMVTPRDIDQLIDKGARLISSAVNIALQPQLSPDDIAYLTA
jgi:spore protease